MDEVGQGLGPKSQFLVGRLMDDPIAYGRPTQNSDGARHICTTWQDKGEAGATTIIFTLAHPGLAQYL